MLFKNAQVYKFTQPLSVNFEELEAKLKEFKIKPLGSGDIVKMGWTEPMGSSGQMFTHAIGESVLITMSKEEKILPSSVVNQMVSEKVDEIELAEDRKLKKKEKDAIKEEVVYTLLPRAFSKTTRTYAWIDTNKDMLYVDASSTKKAEELISLLRKTLGSLPVVPLQLHKDIPTVMTQWISDSELPEGFSVNGDAKLTSTAEDGGYISCKQQDLSSDEIQNHLATDKIVTQLAMQFGATVSFTMGDEFALKSIKFSSELDEGEGDDDFASKFDSDFVFMTEEIDLVVTNLVEAFGGMIEEN